MSEVEGVVVSAIRSLVEYALPVQSSSGIIVGALLRCASYGDTLVACRDKDWLLEAIAYLRNRKQDEVWPWEAAMTSLGSHTSLYLYLGAYIPDRTALLPILRRLVGTEFVFVHNDGSPDTVVPLASLLDGEVCPTNIHPSLCCCINLPPNIDRLLFPLLRRVYLAGPETYMYTDAGDTITDETVTAVNAWRWRQVQINMSVTAVPGIEEMQNQFASHPTWPIQCSAGSECGVCKAYGCGHTRAHPESEWFEGLSRRGVYSKRDVTMHISHMRRHGDEWSSLLCPRCASGEPKLKVGAVPAVTRFERRRRRPDIAGTTRRRVTRAYDYAQNNRNVLV